MQDQIILIIRKYLENKKKYLHPSNKILCIEACGMYKLSLVGQALTAYTGGGRDAGEVMRLCQWAKKKIPKKEID